MCQALKDTQRNLERLTDQTESEEATLRANALPLKKRSLAFMCAVLKYNVSPGMINEMISNLREMRTEIQDRLRHLKTSLNDVEKLHDGFYRELVRVTIWSRLSTSTTLTARVELASWLEKFGEQHGFSERVRNERRAVSPLNLLLEF